MDARLKFSSFENKLSTNENSEEENRKLLKLVSIHRNNDLFKELFETLHNINLPDNFYSIFSKDDISDLKEYGRFIYENKDFDNGISIASLEIYCTSISSVYVIFARTICNEFGIEYKNEWQPYRSKNNGIPETFLFRTLKNQSNKMIGALGKEIYSFYNEYCKKVKHKNTVRSNKVNKKNFSKNEMKEFVKDVNHSLKDILAIMNMLILKM